MVLIHWLERGLGQFLAPDANYKDQPDVMDTQSELWQTLAPNPDFSEQPVTNGPPPQAFQDFPKNATTRRVHRHIETPIQDGANDTTDEFSTPRNSDEPEPVFMSPVPTKKYGNKEQGSINYKIKRDGSMLTRTEEQVLLASYETKSMTLRNPMFREQAAKLLKFCSSSGPLKEKALQNIESLLEKDSDRVKFTNRSETSILCSRSYGLGAVCPDGFTPLMAAAKSGRTEAAKLLMHYAADKEELLHHTDLLGQDALHIASVEGQVSMVRFLQSGDSDDDEKQSPNETPMGQRSELLQTQDMSSLTAWDAAMTSPILRARKKRGELDKLLSPPLSKKKAMTRIHRSLALDLKYTTAHLDGRRVFNEDALICTHLKFCNGMLFVVADGHGDCGSVATFVCQKLPEYLERFGSEYFEKSNDQALDMWTQICQDSAHSVDDELKKAHIGGGSTAVWAIVTESHTIVANVGDSRCILLQKEQVINLSEDHRPDLPREKERIEKAGLKVKYETYTDESKSDGDESKTISIAKVQLSEMNQMGTSRTFGDFEYKNTEDEDLEAAVICTPEVVLKERALGNDEFLVLACDGIWDVSTSEKVGELVRSKHSAGAPLSDNAESLLQACYHSDDNLSVILVQFDVRTDEVMTDFSRLTVSDPADDENDIQSRNLPETAKKLTFGSPEKP